MQRVFLITILVALVGCDSVEQIGPAESTADYETNDVYLAGAVPADASVAVSYVAYDEAGRPMPHVITLNPRTSPSGSIEAHVFLPTTLDNVEQDCALSLNEAGPDRTFEIAFDAQGRVRGDSVFDVPYVDDAHVARREHRVHFGDVTLTSTSHSIPAGHWVTAARQDGYQSDLSRREELAARDTLRARQTNHVYFGGSVAGFRTMASGYSAYDRDGGRLGYGFTAACARTGCTSGDLLIGVYMPGTLDSLYSLPEPKTTYDQHPPDHEFALTFGHDGRVVGVTSFVVPFPAGVDANPDFHTLHFDDVSRADGRELSYCRQDGVPSRN